MNLLVYNLLCYYSKNILLLRTHEGKNGFKKIFKAFNNAMNPFPN